MHVREILSKRHTELKASIEAVEAEIRDIELALKAMGGGVTPSTVNDTAAENRFQIRHSMPVNDAVILAVEAGRKTPVSILDYIQKDLKIDTTLNSVRSRVSLLKKDGKIGHDGSGWVSVKSNSGSLI